MSTTFAQAETDMTQDDVPQDEAGPTDAAKDLTPAVQSELRDRMVGEILRSTDKLTLEQVDAVLERQRSSGERFGDAAVALGYVLPGDVMEALSHQFHYPFAQRTQGVVDEELYVANEPFGDDAESFRDLRSQLLLSTLSPNADKRVALAVVSSDVGDGKSFIASNLAVAFSHLPGRTLLLEADMRAPRLHKVFNIEGGSGLSTVLSGRTDTSAIRPVKELPNLYILPAGAIPPNPLELLQQLAFDMLLKEMIDKFDYVLVDTPAAEYGTDAKIIAAKCGAALVVTCRNKTRSVGLQTLVTHLTRSHTAIAGVVMNEHA